MKGVRTDDPKTNGCPPNPDRDGDGIPDAEDACPDQKGPPNKDPKKNGCPGSVVMLKKEIIILEQVEFDIDRATIKPVSNKLLDEVGTVLKEHPELLRLEVQGHTDNTGGKEHNKTLSQKRADAVMAALVKRGVARDRLTAKGYGQEVPVAANITTDGRRKNRRVQFIILETKNKGAP